MAPAHSRAVQGTGPHASTHGPSFMASSEQGCPQQLHSPAPTRADCVQMRDLYKQFETKRGGKATVVDHLDLEFHPNQVVALLGPSGSGVPRRMRLCMQHCSPGPPAMQVAAGPLA